MKKYLRTTIIALQLVIVIHYSGYSQLNIVKLDYQFYTSYFSTTEHIPIVVAYTLTQDMLNCTDPIPRSNKFSADPNHSDITSLSKDYRNSGYDKGHNMSAQDNRCYEEGMTQCFYFSNMTPQPHSFNAGRWEDTEKFERKEAKEYGKVIVTIGSIGKATTIGADKVVVPKIMWKVIYVPL